MLHQTGHEAFSSAHLNVSLILTARPIIIHLHRVVDDIRGSINDSTVWCKKGANQVDHVSLSGRPPVAWDNIPALHLRRGECLPCCWSTRSAIVRLRLRKTSALKLLNARSDQAEEHGMRSSRTAKTCRVGHVSPWTVHQLMVCSDRLSTSASESIEDKKAASSPWMASSRFPLSPRRCSMALERHPTKAWSPQRL